MASTHPNSIFRWEDAASLEHACWQCPTKANSPRALQTCYGLHSMPCTSYHPTMHAVGAAHRCSGCVNTREMRDARHREIAEMVAEYKSLESPMPATPPRTPLLERNINTVTTNRTNSNSTATSSGRVVDTDFDMHEDDDQDQEDDSTSLSSYAPSTAGIFSTAVRKLTKAEIRAQKKAKKSAKSQSKALKNQSRHLAAITSSDVEHVGQVLHGDQSDAIFDGSAHPLATDRTIEDVIARNLNFVKNIQAHRQYLFKSVAVGRRENMERKRLKKRESQGEASNETVEIGEVVSAIMIKLGLPFAVVSATSTTSTLTSGATVWSNANSFSSGRKRSSSLTLTPTPTSSPAGKGSLAIVHKLRAAIKTDLEKHDNEIHARYVRAGGFWRYVGKTVFERMTTIARELDVSTGERWEKKWAREAKASSNDADVDDGEGDGELE